MKRFIAFVWDELSHSDAVREPAKWYQKGNTLLAHAMLGVGVNSLLVVVFGGLLWAVLLFEVLGYLYFKEGRDIEEGGDQVIPDSLMDTLGVSIGLSLPLALVSGPGWVVCLLMVALVGAWVSYPLRKFS